MTDAKKLTMICYGLLVLFVAAVYVPTLNHGFVWDDTAIIVNKPLLQSLGNLPRIFLAEDTAMGSTGYYRPVTYVSFALDRAIWGLNPFGFHLTNLVLHLLVVVIFQKVIAELFNNDRLAFVAALILALHPVAGETVNFLAGGRNTLLCACFTLLSLLFYLRHKPVAVVVCFTVAIFSKEFALLLPLVFLLHDYRLQQKKVRFSSYIPYLIPIGCYLVLRSIAVEKANFISLINVPDTLKAPYLLARYVLNMILPVDLKILYDVQPGLLASMLCLGVVVAMIGVVYVFRKQEEILFAAFWFFLFFLPVINIIPLESASLMADRYAYFPLMGFALCLATLICRVNGKFVLAGVAGLCAVYAYIDVTRNSIWENDINFFTRMIKDAPEKFDGYQNLGMYYYKKGEIARALPYLTTALAKPDTSAMFLIGSASVFWKEHMLDRAEQALLRALELNPSDPEPYLMLITMYERSGNSGQALSYRDKTERLFHDVGSRLASRAAELCREGKGYLSRQLYIPAENVFWQALMIDANNIPALIDMGSLSANQGDLATAIRYFSRVLSLNPLNAQAHYNLAMVYRRQGKLLEAEHEMEKFREAEAASRVETVPSPR